MRVPFFWRILTLLAALNTMSASALAATPQIALLLPQSGRMAKAAETIQLGFLAAYYQDSPHLTESPIVRFYDSDSQNIVTLVQQVYRDGATLIIGPLSREHLEKLLQAGPPPVPLLALNNADASSENIYQFALAPEDEIQRLIAWIDQQKQRHPLLLAGSDNYGQRQVRLFQTAWQASHSELLDTVPLNASNKVGITAAVRDAVNQKNSRYDAIFLASPALVRQVLAALTVYHVHLPLYSLSAAWDPTANDTARNSLDDLHFCDLPWMLDDTRPEQATLYKNFTRPTSSYDRLYAFGADAWTLVQQWQTMNDGKAIFLRSGLVHSDSSHHLRRIPSCAEVHNGIATPTWRPASQDGD